MNHFVFKRADVTEIPLIQLIANQTWPDTYESILGKEQVAYMLDLLYSTPALTQQFEEGNFFYFIYNNNVPAGFASFGKINQDTYKLHKIYVLTSEQGSGCGKALLEFVIRKVTSLGASHLLLNVNKNNKAKGFYEKFGFVVIEEKDIPIGNGFYMNDYIMQLDL